MAKAITTSICNFLLMASIFVPMATRAEPPKLPVPVVDQSAVAQRGYFYVGGKYVGEPGNEIMQGQAYVEVLAPKDVRRPYRWCLSTAPPRPPPTGWARPMGAKAGPSISSSRAISST